eukprot:7962877-Alexandrium_andersonii.AAC.1
MAETAEVQPTTERRGPGRAGRSSAGSSPGARSLQALWEAALKACTSCLAMRRGARRSPASPPALLQHRASKAMA